MPLPTTPLTRALHAALFAALVVVAVRGGMGDEVLFWAALVAPDLALIGAFADGPGRLHARAVPRYNAGHAWWGPMAVGAASLLVPALAPVAVAWAIHVSLDRALGYGLRTREGFQRSVAAPAWCAA
ncbi:MAG TPA: DUF4260 family protein [Solirubrobacteraceae bacterium]|nr:DUF4260 family protein [Solirubrobacteraceae bacterium]